MGKKYGNYHLQYLFDDLHVIYMFFTYYVNFQLFQCKKAHFSFFLLEVRGNLRDYTLKEEMFTLQSGCERELA